MTYFTIQRPASRRRVPSGRGVVMWAMGLMMMVSTTAYAQSPGMCYTDGVPLASWPAPSYSVAPWTPDEHVTTAEERVAQSIDWLAHIDDDPRYAWGMSCDGAWSCAPSPVIISSADSDTSSLPHAPVCQPYMADCQLDGGPVPHPHSIDGKGPTFWFQRADARALNAPVMQPIPEPAARRHPHVNDLFSRHLVQTLDRPPRG